MTEINIENRTHELSLNKRTNEYTFCPLCETLVDLCSLEQAAEHCAAAPEEITRLIQTRSIHCLHNAEGAVSICFNSLQAAYCYVRETAPLTAKKLRAMTAGNNR